MQEDVSEQFVRLLTRHEPQVYAFIRSMVRHWDDAQEVLQETNATLWQKRQEAAEVANFAAWACGIARIEVLRLGQRRRRDRLTFSDRFVFAVADAMVDQLDELEDRREALDGCVQKLRSTDRELLERRYSLGRTTQQLADQAGRSVNAVQKALARIRRSLLECVDRKLAREGLR